MQYKSNHSFKLKITPEARAIHNVVHWILVYMRANSKPINTAHCKHSSPAILNTIEARGVSCVPSSVRKSGQIGSSTRQVPWIGFARGMY